MPPVQASAPLPIVESFPVQFDIFGPSNVSSVSHVLRNTSAASSWIITQLDYTATQAMPVQCFFAAEVWRNGGTSGPTFYYDSQSTGEGNGVWFSWRGALPLAPNDALAVVASSVSAIVWGGVVSGVVGPWAGYVH
jgi:hypothetical protein